MEDTMTAHLTINGRTLCDHTACLAGIEDRAAAARHVFALPTGLTCDYDSPWVALRAALGWKEAHPRHNVAVVLGPCPEAGK